MPSDMSEEAMVLGLAKYHGKARPYPPSRLKRMLEFLVSRVAPLWTAVPCLTRADVCKLINWQKSPGWPWYYDCEDKFDAMAKHGHEIWSRVERVKGGDETVPLYFNGTLKDELRPEEKVQAHKTRVFCASDFVHLLASKELFGAQNLALLNSRGKHPLTVGVSVPGPEFVTTVVRLQRNIYEADIGGSDTNFPLGPAAVIREARKRFLPRGLHAGCNYLYNSLYCGYVVVCGYLLRLWGMKSGCENTIWDTSLLYWIVMFEYFDLRYPHLNMMRNFEKHVRCIFNGDDELFGNELSRFNILDMVAYYAERGMVLEVKSEKSMGPLEVTYLSHHVRHRFVEGYGDILVAAGNKDKLLSSLNYIRRKGTMTLEESCLTHLLGLRVALWPYYVEFLTVEEMIDTYVSRLRQAGLWTDRLTNFMAARISEEQIVELHTRLEGGFVFYPPSLDWLIDDFYEWESGKLTSPLKETRSLQGTWGYMSSKSKVDPKALMVKGKKGEATLVRADLAAEGAAEAASKRAKKAAKKAAKAARRAALPPAPTPRVVAVPVRAVPTGKYAPSHKTALVKTTQQSPESPAKLLALTIMLPSKFAAKFPVLQSLPTVALPLRQVQSMPSMVTVAASGSSPEIDITEMRALKFKDSALRSLMLWWPAVPTKPLYNAVWYNGPAGLQTMNQMTMVTGTVYEFNPLMFTLSTGTAIFGQNQYCARGENFKRYFFLNGSKDKATQNGSISISWAPNIPSNQNFQVKLWYTVNGDQEYPVSETVLGAGSNQIVLVPGATFCKSGYYRVTILYTPGNAQLPGLPTVFTFSAVKTEVANDGWGGWGITALPNLESKFPIIDEYRINGADMKISQKSSVTNMNGTVIQNQIPANQPVLVNATKQFSDIGKINALLQDDRALYQGCDGYIKPGALGDFDMQSDFDTDDAGVLVSADYDLVPKEPFIMSALSVPTQAGGVFSITTGDSVEYSTSDPWIDISGKRTSTMAHLQNVVEQVGKYPQFFDNPNHIQTIGQLLSMGGQLAQMVAPAAGPYAPALMAGGTIASLGGQILGGGN